VTHTVLWKNVDLPINSHKINIFSQNVQIAALRYAGKKSGLYPADALQALAVDEILDIVQDILTKSPQVCMNHQQPEVDYFPCFENGDFSCRMKSQWLVVQGYLAHKKQRPPRTLQ